jgi:hypothetical protein
MRARTRVFPRARRTGAGWLVATALVVGLPLGSLVLQSGVQDASAKGPRAACNLGTGNGNVKHVIDVIFDNTHFTRDNPNVPSDLEQMPNLLDFIEGNGTLLSQEHTPLIAHTGTDILSHLTGQYGDTMGEPIANAFGFYDNSTAASFRSSFAYWTAGLGGSTDNTPFMLTRQGKNAPAPWVPYTRAGCNVGQVASANTILENTRFDIPAVFGANSPENAEQTAAFNIPCGFGSNPPCTPAQQKAKNQPQADFVGIGVHCGRGSTLCNATGGVNDVLRDEPGGYTGFKMLMGAKYTDPVISPSGPVTDLNGNVVADSTGNPGFPGFDSMSAATSLGFVADMQEHGVPVTYAYISDAHDDHVNGRAFGPGQAGYVAALKSYDDAFGKFFTRLAADGINSSNTIFEFTSDEGDHFVGGAPSPANCDGATVPCTYSRIGELEGNVTGMLGANAPAPTCAGAGTIPLDVHSDSSPTIYVRCNPSQTDTVTRTIERGLGHIQAVNPITGETDHVTNAIAGVAEMNALHMITGDPKRNPTMTLFARPDYFLCATGFSCPETDSQIHENAGFAWNHGDNAPDINTTWLGLVGPGVKHNGVDSTTWADHTDDRPTELALAGLTDDYTHDGRVLVEAMTHPQQVGDVAAYEQLARAYKQLDASVGIFGEETLRASTIALESGDTTNDTRYTTFTSALTALVAQRDALAAQIESLLDISGPSHGHVNVHAADQLSAQAMQLLQAAGELGGGV